MEVQQYSAQIRAKKQLTKDVFECQFEKPLGFDYLAGQFVQFLIPQGESIKRLAYSLSSIPSDDFIEFCIKIHDDGVGCQYVLKMKENDTLNFQGPRGLFVHKENTTSLSFIGTGTGIAPLLALVRDELENKNNTSEMRLLFGVRSEEDLFWITRLEELHTKYSNFTYTVTLSQPTAPETWTGLRGRVTEHLQKYFESQKFYLCGSAAMIKDVREILIKNGVEAKGIHFEVF